MTRKSYNNAQVNTKLNLDLVNKRLNIYIYIYSKEEGDGGGGGEEKIREKSCKNCIVIRIVFVLIFVCELFFFTQHLYFTRALYFFFSCSHFIGMSNEFIFLSIDISYFFHNQFVLLFFRIGQIHKG